MALTLHYHPLSSYCQKLLIALYELGKDFEPRLLDLGDPAAREAFVALWPTGKMPLLVDDGQPIPESSIAIEHIDRGQQLLPPTQALAVRLWDRLLDCYVMTPMQAVVANRLREPAQRDPLADAQAARTLAMAYAMLERQLRDGEGWVVGDRFSLADCAAAPALFYASTVLPFAATQPRLQDYFERLLARPSVARVLAEAGPYFRYYPLRDALPERFLAPAQRP